jgi:hypothetical protein
MRKQGGLGRTVRDRRIDTVRGGLWYLSDTGLEQEPEIKQGIQKSFLDADPMEKDFTRMIEQWKKIYSK